MSDNEMSVPVGLPGEQRKMSLMSGSLSIACFICCIS